ncbi:MAG: hypothetical protein ABIT76_13990 [Chthoniobacterales bacterium]
MARHRFLLTLAACAAWLSSVVCAQETPTPTPVERPVARPPDQRPRQGRDPRFREMREGLEKMPEEQRQRIFDKFRKWQQMPADEQAHFRFMQEEREKRARQAVDDTIQASGLKLDDAQKVKFTEVYKRERRKLEEELRAEMDKRRQERLPELQKTVIATYQKEAAEPTPAASPSPSATP